MRTAQNRGNSKRGLAGLLLVASIMLCLPGTVGAEDVVGYTVAPILPENQQDFTHAYFDLRMAPGQQQVLQVEIINTSSEEMHARIELVTPYTGENGVIEYAPDGQPQDHTLPLFTDIAETAESQVAVAAGESLLVDVTVTMPETAYAGELFGAIRVTKMLPHEIDPDAAAQSGEGVMLHNQFTYAIGVLLTTTDEVVKPAFSLESVTFERVHYRNAVALRIRNTQPLLINPMKVEVSIYHGDEVILETVHETAKITPESSMPYILYWPDDELEEGTYRSMVTLAYEGETWQFEQEFQVQ